jgi:Glyoxalase-like domain
MSEHPDYPLIRQTVLDCQNARALAEFYRNLCGLRYRPGDELEPATNSSNENVDKDWLVLRDSDGNNRLAFQQIDDFKESTWPENSVPQQIHLDMTVPTIEHLVEQHDRVLSLGGRLLYDRFDDPEEPLRVYADPSGHPFCIFVAP